MTKRALLIGSQTGGLSGVDADVKAVQACLAHWGFATDLCMGTDATRQGILKGYLDLIAKTEADDPVVVYYSGHGGRAPNPDYQSMTAEGKVVPSYFQFIVPFDIDASTEDDFRGITSLELSALLAKLTNKTRNATVVLDCCHSACMSRDLNFMPRAWPRPLLISIGAHMKQLAKQGISLDAVDVESNPNAVRLVAAAPEESAFEYTNRSFQRVGVLTESFLMALGEAEGQKVSWRTLGTRIRERVCLVMPYQRPEIEGPADRLLFEVDTVDMTGVLPVIKREGQPVLQGGSLLGTHVGDVYAIVPMGVEKPTRDNVIARATVESVTAAISTIRLDKPAAIPDGANAFPLSTALPKRPVRITAADAEMKQFVAEIESSRQVRAVAKDDPGEVLAEVVVANGQIKLRDRAGLSLVEPKPYSPETVRATVENLDRFARKQTLLELPSGEGANALKTLYHVEWGRVVDGQPQPLTRSGQVVFVGEPLYVQVKNTGQDKIYVSLFDVGVGGAIALLSGKQPSGVRLEPGEDYVYGGKMDVALKGVKLFWPAGIPADAPRLESLLVICSDRPQDLRALAQVGMREAKTMRTSPLQEIVEQVAWGGTRDAPMESQPDADVRYSVSRIDFQLDPNPAPARDAGTFLIDERPNRSFQVSAPVAKGDVPAHVAVRLKDLIVHSNKRLLGATEIRVDALVVTAPKEGDAESPYKVETFAFPGIKDGDRLPFDNMLVYQGPVSRFLDMAVWVSRNQKDSLTLAEMFKTELNTTEFKEAAAVLAGLAVAAPQAALVVGAVGASATLVNIGTKLLLQSLGTSIGLYRTSHLAFERFGVGCHPANGLMRAQEFSFGYEIVQVD